MKQIIKNIYSKIPFKKQIFEHLRYLNFNKKIYQHLCFNDWFTIEIPNTEKSFLMYHYGYLIENEIFWKGIFNGWEKDSLKIWAELPKNSSVIIDIGANTGIYSLLAASINPSAKIYAFEPVERVYNKLKLNVNRNKFNNISVYNMGLSNKNGKAYIYDTDSEHIYSVTINKNLNPSLKTTKKEVDIIRLDNFITENKISNIDLMKIDVETHEPEVIEGLGEFLKKYNPDMLIEVLNEEVAKKLSDFFEDMDYHYYNIDEQGNLECVKSLKKSKQFNFLICKDETRKKLNLSL